jgi:alkylated DNA repair dioxygenase AlkB
MLFGRTVITETGVPSTGLPSFIDDLVLRLDDLCRSFIPSEIHKKLFPSGQSSRSRQVIFNRYHPGEGIAPHIDLLDRYDDGIIGVSLGSCCSMDFKQVDSSQKQEMSLWLPENSVIILEGEARYQWTHGIRPLHGDVVEDGPSGMKWIPRGVRTSITLRWLLPGADIVGSEG